MIERQPRILFLSSSWPHGKTFGGQLRALHVGRALMRIGDVTVAVVSADGSDSDAEQRTRMEFTAVAPVIPQVRPNCTILEKLRWAFDLHYLNVHGFSATSKDRERVIAMFSQYDLVWVLNCRTPNILHVRRWPHAHLDLDDLPSTYFRAVIQNSSDGVGRWRAR